MASNSGKPMKKNAEPNLDSPTNLSPSAVTEVSELLRQLLAGVFTLYMKTRNFHWHMTGRHFRDYHLLLDEQAAQLFAITDTIAERARKIGGKAIRSAGDILQHRRLEGNNQESVAPGSMLRELACDNRALTSYLLAVHEV